MGASVVHLVKSMVLFLTCSVPQIDEESLSTDVYLFVLERGVHSTCLMLIELILAVLKGQRRLSDSCCEKLIY